MTVEMDRLTRATFPHARPRRLRRTEAMRPTRLAGREAGRAGSADVIVRAGATLTITYYAKDAARWKHDT